MKRVKKIAKRMSRCLAGVAAAGLLLISWPGPAYAVPPLGIVVKQSKIDLFKGPGTSYPIVGAAGKGEHLNVVGEKGSWSEVRTSAGTTGWIPEVLAEMDGGPGSLPAAVIADDVHIRAYPGSDSSVLATVSRGGYLVVRGQSGQWYEVRTLDGMLGWVDGSMTQPAADTGQQASVLNISAQPPVPAGPGTVTVSQPRNTLFAGPGSGTGIIGQATKGTILTVLNTAGGWTKVQLPAGPTGWIPAVLVTQDQRPDARQEWPRAQAILGKGEWIDIYSKLPQAGDLSNFAAAGVTHIYLEVATSYSGFPARWQGWLNTILPAAHKAGIKVIAWVYVKLDNPLKDAQLTAQVANYVTPQGDRPDGVGADIETLPQDNPVAANQLVVAYASLTRPKLPAGMPLVAITFPPQYRTSYPWVAMGADFDAVALMDYWHITTNNYNFGDTESFVANSLTTARSLAKKSMPLETILQGYDNSTGMPSSQEMQGALAGSAGAQGYSVYTWDSALGTPAGDVFTKFRTP